MTTHNKATRDWKENQLKDLKCIGMEMLNQQKK